MLKQALSVAFSRPQQLAFNAPQGSRSFHAGSTLLVRQKHLKRLNRLHKHWAKQMFKTEEEWVDPVLGRSGTPFLARVRALIGQPENQIDRLEPESTSKLLYSAERAAARAGAIPETVPNTTSTSTSTSTSSTNPGSGRDEEDSSALAQRMAALNLEKSELKRETVLRIISLQNSNTQQSQKQAAQLARQEFQRFEGDTGSPEVQAAIATIKIQFVAAHAKETKKDVQTKRRLEHMVQSRRNILLYLKRIDPRRYIWTIEKLGLSDSSVSAEFHMSRKYLWRTQFYGDKTLPMKQTVKDTKKARQHAAKLQKAQRYLAQHDPEALIRA